MTLFATNKGKTVGSFSAVCCLAIAENSEALGKPCRLIRSVTLRGLPVSIVPNAASSSMPLMMTV